jgi:phosphomannomutase
MVPATIFKSYDVRGIYPTEINGSVAEAIGRAIALLVGSGRAVVGRDMRLSSPELHQALINGLRAGGLKVDDIGLVPIDAVYFSVPNRDYDVGVMVTASHNPPAYNGFKIMRRHTQWVRGAELAKYVDQVNSYQGEIGEYKMIDIWPAYIKHVRSFIDPLVFKPLKIVIDAGNGMAGKAVPLIFQGLPFKIEPLFFELDGSFPNRQSNPLLPGAAQACAQKILASGADVGIMFDGDTDRIFLLDEQGRFVPADVTLLLLAREFLHRQPGAAIAYNLICSRAVPEFITKWGGQPIRTAVGYVNVSQALLHQGAVMGGELSAHYCFKDNAAADSGMIAALMLLETLSRLNKPLSELVREYSPYAKAPEVNLEVDNKSAVLTKLKQKFHEAEIDELDGVTVSYADWWVNVRPSNTEPLLRVTVEAKNETMLKAKQAEILDFIKQQI